MHNSLNYLPTPLHLRPYVPSVHGFRPTGHRVDPGFIPSEPAPPPVYRPLPPPELLISTGFTPKDCLGCGEEFVPRSSNNVRCDPCAKIQRAVKAAEREARKTKAARRRTIMLIDQATRQRARRAAAHARRKVAA